MNGPSTHTQAAALESTATKPQIPVFASKRTNGWPQHEGGRLAQYTALAEALESNYPTDAHFAAYSVPTIARRLATPKAIEALADKGGIAMVLKVTDVDAPIRPIEKKPMRATHWPRRAYREQARCTQTHLKTRMQFIFDCTTKCITD